MWKSEIDYKYLQDIKQKPDEKQKQVQFNTNSIAIRKERLDWFDEFFDEEYIPSINVNMISSNNRIEKDNNNNDNEDIKQCEEIRLMLENEDMIAYSIIRHDNEVEWQEPKLIDIQDGKYQIRYLLISEFKRLTYQLQLDYLVRVLIQQENDEMKMLKILEISDVPTRRRLTKKIMVQYPIQQTPFKTKLGKQKQIMPWYKMRYEDILSGRKNLPKLQPKEIDKLDKYKQIQYYFYQDLQKLHLFEKQKFGIGKIEEINSLPYKHPIIIKSKKRYQQYIGNIEYSIYKLLKHENETQWYDIDFGMMIFKGYLSLDYLSKQEILKLNQSDRERYYLLETLQEYMDDPLLSTLYTQPFVNFKQIKQHIRQYGIEFSKKTDMLINKESELEKENAKLKDELKQCYLKLDEKEEKGLSVTELRNNIKYLKNDENANIYTDNKKRLRMITSEYTFENYHDTGVTTRVKFESGDPNVESEFIDVLARIKTIHDDKKDMVENEDEDDDVTRVLKKIKLDLLELECYHDHGIISNEKQMVTMILKKLSPEMRMKYVNMGAKNWDPPTLLGEIETQTLSPEKKKKIMKMLKNFYQVVKQVQVVRKDEDTIYLCKKEGQEQYGEITWIFGKRRSNIDFYKREHFWFMGDWSLPTRFMYDEHGEMRIIYKESLVLRIKDNDKRRICRRLLGLRSEKPNYIDSNYIYKMKQKLMKTAYKYPFKRLSRMHIIYTLHQLPLDMKLYKIDEILHSIDTEMGVKVYCFEKRKFINGPPSEEEISEVNKYEERQEAMYLIIHKEEIEAKLKAYFSKSKQLIDDLSRVMDLASRVKLKLNKNKTSSMYKMKMVTDTKRPTISDSHYDMLNMSNTFESISMGNISYIPFQNRNYFSNFYISILRSISYFDLITFTRDLICTMDDIFAESNILAIKRMVEMENNEVITSGDARIEKRFYYTLLQLFYQVLNEKKLQAYVIVSLQREIKCNLRDYMGMPHNRFYGDMSPKLWNCDMTEMKDDGFYIDNVKIFDIEDILKWQMGNIIDTLSFVDNKISKPDNQAVLGVDKTNIFNLNAILNNNGWNTLLEELQNNQRLTARDKHLLYHSIGSQSKYMLVKPNLNVKLMRGIYRAPFSAIVHSRKCRMFRLVLYNGVRRICCPHRKKLIKCRKCRPVQCKFPCAYYGKAVIEVVLNHYIRGHGMVICHHLRDLTKCPHCRIGTKVVVFW